MYIHILIIPFHGDWLFHWDTAVDWLSSGGGGDDGGVKAKIKY